MSANPMGEQWEITSGEQRAWVSEVGATLRAYTIGAWHLLDGYAADESCTGGRGQLLLPWPNRLAHGRYEWRGEQHQVALTEPEQDNAIHGLVRWANWRCLEHEGDRVVLGLRLHAHPGWPWVLDLRQEYSLSNDGLVVRTHAQNRSGTPCPFGVGAHPYISLGAEQIDGATLTAPGMRHMLTDDHQIPVSAEPVDGTPFDFLEPRVIGSTKLDTGFSELARDPDGLARIVIEGEGRRLALWLDESYPFLMLFTGDALEPARRRTGLGVEPMSCAPNALRSGEGLSVLEPEQCVELAWGITPG